MKRVTKERDVPLETRLNSNASALPGGLVFASPSTQTSIPEEYPFRLNSYSNPPNYDITVEQFEEYAFSRLQCKLY